MKVKIQYFCGLFVLFLASAVSGDLTPVYEVEGDSRKLFQINKPLVFTCTPDAGSDYKKLEWKKNGVKIKDVEELKNHHYSFDEKKGKFIVDRAREEDAGNYSCTLDGKTFTFEAFAQVAVKIPENTYIVENEKLEITCLVKGTQPEISWRYTNNTNDPKLENSVEIDRDDDRIKLETHDDIEYSRLIIDHVAMQDRGIYFCVGTNNLMNERNVDAAESEGIVRVKDKLAPLWPFLGITAEVLILCTIILIYEKRRNKTDLDESDTDQSPDQKNDIKDSRHR